MGYILNYSRWRAIHEAAIFEAEVPSQTDLAPGTQLANLRPGWGLYNKLLPDFQAQIKSDAALKKLCAEIYKKLVIDGKKPVYADNVPPNIYSDKTGVVLFTLLFAAATAGISDSLRKDIIPGSTTMAQTGTVKLVPGTTEGFIKTLGRYVNTLKTDSDGEEKESSYGGIKLYCNMYNIQAALNRSNNGQYVGELTRGRWDFSTTTSVDPGEIVLFVESAVGATVATRSVEEIKKEIAGIPAEKQRADVDFDQGKSTIKQEGIAKITTLAETILERFKDKTIEKFELISSASPEWTGGETMANYAGKTTSGTGDPGVGKDFASNNAKLAYDRGVSFMTELNKQLQAKGHPGFSNYTINWQITDKGGPANTGRYVDLNLVTNESKPRVEVVGTKVTGSQTQAEITGGKAASEFVVYKFKVQIPMTKKEAKKSLKAVPEEGAEEGAE